MKNFAVSHLQIKNIPSLLFVLLLALSPLHVLAGKGGGKSAARLIITSPEEGLTIDKGSYFSLAGIALDKRDGDISTAIEWSSNIDGAVATGSDSFISLSVGRHIIESKVTNSIGKTSKKTVSVTVLEQQPENSLPTISILSPTNGDSSTNGELVVFTGQASDVEDGDLSNQILWISNIDGELGKDNSLSTVLSVGEHLLTATVSDTSGGIQTKTVNFLVTQIDLPDTLPELSILSPQPGSLFGELGMIDFKASALDNEDGDLSHLIEWVSNLDGVLGTGRNLSNVLSIGEHLVEASVTDSYGQTAYEQVMVRVTQQFGAAFVSWVAPLKNTDGSALTDLVGFKIYYGSDIEQMTKSILVEDPTVLTWVFESLPNNQTTYFAVVALNVFGVESEMSEVVSKFIP